LEEAFAQEPAHDWVDKLVARNVPAALIQTVNEAICDARGGSREMVIEISGEDGRSVAVIGNPIKFPGEAPTAPGFPPRLGENTAALLAHSLSLSEAEIALLYENGVIGMAPRPKHAAEAVAGASELSDL
jgi:crotonobetainyl-CoA:carnitine CoA-transferase CaiB-like acyl-CoA transferase